MTSHPVDPVRHRVLTFAAAALAVLVAVGLVVNALLVPPSKPAGTNSVVTGDFGRSEYPNVPADERFSSSKIVNRCQVGVGTLGAWQWTADSFRLQFRLTSSVGPSRRIINHGPDKNIWGNPTMFDGIVKAGHSYRFGPATVKVLQVWNSPIPQYRRAYLKVTFDESQIRCPPPRDYTAG